MSIEDPFGMTKSFNVLVRIYAQSCWVNEGCFENRMWNSLEDEAIFQENIKSISVLGQKFILLSEAAQ